MAIISQKSVQVVSQSSGLNPPLNFYLTVGRGTGVSLNPGAFLVQGLSPSSIGQTLTTSSGPDFDYLVYTLTHGPDPAGETRLYFVLSATPVGGGILPLAPSQIMSSYRAAVHLTLPERVSLVSTCASPTSHNPRPPRTAM
jgi:hypothetical protein